MTRSLQLRHAPLRLLLLLPLLWLNSLAHAAENPWYEVEIIVFAQERESYRASEAWRQDFAVPAVARARMLTSQEGSGRAFQALDPARYRLQGEWRRLQNSAEYRPLLHTAWRQPGLPREQAVEVLLEAGAVSPELGGARPLSGVVKVGLARYLHLDANLLYRSPRKVESSEEDGLRFDTFQLNESRRMRSREIHYLDHPMFGVIALITPLQ